MNDGIAAMNTTIAIIRGKVASVKNIQLARNPNPPNITMDINTLRKSFPVMR
jgi:hypothetical protein